MNKLPHTQVVENQMAVVAGELAAVWFCGGEPGRLDPMPVT